MDLAVWQIILLVILAACTILDALTLVIGLNFPVITGTLAGIIMGDMVLGLAIGATLQLMVLGVGTYGGASIPDFTTGAIVGTVFAVLSGQDAEFAIGLAIPVGLLMVQLDILARFTNTFFLHRIDSNIASGNISAVKRNIWYGALPWALSRAVPVFIMLTFGQSVVDFILNEIPEWLMGGLSCSGWNSSGSWYCDSPSLLTNKQIRRLFDYRICSSSLSKSTNARRSANWCSISNHLLQTKFQKSSSCRSKWRSASWGGE